MSNPLEIVAKELPGLGEFDAYEREQAARAVLSALEKAGYRVVAREPTEEMMDAIDHETNYKGSSRRIFKAAHDAAPRYGEPSE
jgi:Fe-S oxidoreductase